jgi:uncharacterized membrane protein YkvA (DUF1232 family)
MLKKVLQGWKAMKAGEILANPEKWKNKQTLINAIAAVVSFAVLLLPIDMAPDDVILLSGSLATILGLFNSYITTATSTKVGLKTKVGIPNK